MSYLHKVRRLDLHLHSNRSDGTLDPIELVSRCARSGLDWIALTDHDLSTDHPTGAVTVDDRTIRVIGGAELSGVHEGHEYHLLVYFPDVIPEGFRAFCRQRVQARATRYHSAVTSLDLPGLDGPTADALAGERSLTRHHLARALVQAGHAADLRDAFRRFADHSVGHVPCIDLSFIDAIRCAREHGGLTSWAHPPLRVLEKFLPAFTDAGLRAIEGIRPMMSSEDRRKVRQVARRFGLLLTGGSDWHGWSDGNPGLFYVEREQVGEFLRALDPVA